MGNEAEETSNLEEPNETPDAAEAAEAVADPAADEAGGIDGEGEAEGAEGEPGDGQGESEEVQIVREGDTQPQASVPRGFLKRVNKLNSKVDTAKEETDLERQGRLRAEETRDLYKARLDQLEGQQPPETLKPPNPDDFAAGTFDADYIAAAQKFQSAFIQSEIQKGIAESTKQTSVTASHQEVARSAERRQVAHYERAAKLGVKDYEATEDKAIAILGNENAKLLISKLDKSELLMYYLGKNEALAEQYAPRLNGPEAMQALVELGGILNEIKVKKPGKSKTTPDPDNELEGGTGIKPSKRGPKGATFE